MLIICCTGNQNPKNLSLTQDQLIQKGQYLVTTMGCNDCHSPKRMGPKGPEIIPERMLSGYPSDQPFPVVTIDTSIIQKGWTIFNPDLTATAGPWGVSFAANLTPDPTGLGTWTIENFKLALSKGKYKGFEAGRTLLPPMPWTNYINMSDEDINAMFAYLKSIPPINNVVPAPIQPNEIK